MIVFMFCLYWTAYGLLIFVFQNLLGSLLSLSDPSCWESLYQHYCARCRWREGGIKWPKYVSTKLCMMPIVTRLKGWRNSKSLTLSKSIRGWIGRYEAMMFKKKESKGHFIYRTTTGTLNCPDLGQVAYLSSYTFWPCASKFVLNLCTIFPLSLMLKFKFVSDVTGFLRIRKYLNGF